MHGAPTTQRWAADPRAAASPRLNGARTFPLPMHWIPSTHLFTTAVETPSQPRQCQRLGTDGPELVQYSLVHNIGPTMTAVTGKFSAYVKCHTRNMPTAVIKRGFVLSRDRCLKMLSQESILNSALVGQGSYIKQEMYARA